MAVNAELKHAQQQDVTQTHGRGCHCHQDDTRTDTRKMTLGSIIIHFILCVQPSKGMTAKTLCHANTGVWEHGSSERTAYTGSSKAQRALISTCTTLAETLSYIHAPELNPWRGAPFKWAHFGSTQVDTQPVTRGCERRTVQLNDMILEGEPALHTVIEIK